MQMLYLRLYTKKLLNHTYLIFLSFFFFFFVYGNIILNNVVALDGHFTKCPQLKWMALGKQAVSNKNRSIYTDLGGILYKKKMKCSFMKSSSFRCF